MDRSALKSFSVHFSDRLTQIIRPLAGTAQETAHFARLWFMRLTALWFMEANAFLPDKKPLFTDGHGGLLSPGDEPQLRKHLCTLSGKLGRIPALSGLFAEEAMHMLPQGLLAENGVLAEMCTQLPPAVLLDFPEILGWLYQYSNTAEREEAFQKVRSNEKIPAEQIPAATQMFTPDWIVRYMTQNALGTIRQPDPDWQYFLSKAEQPQNVSAVLERLDSRRRSRSLAQLTVIDPCMGTGHILAYVFDALMDLYRQEGYAPDEAAACILRNNLYGLDIDENACALAGFVLLMKARRYDETVLQKCIRLHLYHFADLEVPESVGCAFTQQFADAKVFGSLLCPEPLEISGVPAEFQKRLDRMEQLSRVLRRRYDAVITNPPYMGSSNMNPKLSAFVRRNYPDSKADLFAAFMERCAAMTAKHGCFAMITQHAWMFLSSYEKLRQKMQKFTLQSMVHLGARAFSQTDVGTIVQTTAFVCMGSFVKDYRTTYLRLTEDEDKERAFFEQDKRYVCDTGRFSGIAGSPVCYWISGRMQEVLKMPKLSEYCRICQGMTTSDNKRFLRYWHEVHREDIAFGCADAAAAQKTGKRWFPYNKGGKFRKWYGNQSHVVNFYNNGEEMRMFHAELNKAHSGGRIKNETMYFRPAVTWPFITESTKFGVRYQPRGALFDVSGSSLFPEDFQTSYLMGLLSSKVTLEIMKLYNPTMNFQVENVAALPVLWDEHQRPAVESLVAENIALAREEWDSYEQSWDFSCHPLVKKGTARIEDAFAQWEAECRRRKRTMAENERRLNEIFIRTYGLEGELSPEVAESEITLRDADRQRDIRSLLSFAVGCLFGRFHVETVEISLLADNYLSVVPGTGRDAAACVEDFLAAVYGKETLEENLRYIADALGGDGTAREVLRKYFAAEFYVDHCRMYRKRPIYWMADSGRCHAFRGLMYLHRMDEHQLPLLNRQVRAQRVWLCAQRPDGQGTRMQREQALLEKKCAELSAFSEKLTALAKEGAAIRTDDGVLRNYETFRRILAAIR